MKRVLIASALVASLVTGAAAQYAPGDVVVTDQRSTGQTWPLYGVTPGGSVYTITTSLTLSAWSVTPAPDNRTVWVSGKGTLGYTTASVAPDGTIVNFNVDRSNLFSAMDVDGEGQAVLANLVGTNILGYQNNTFTTLFSGAPIQSPAGGGLDLTTGDMLVVQPTGIYSVNLFGTPQASTVVASIPRPNVAGLHADVTSGGLIGSWGSAVYHVSPGAPGQLRTMISVGAVGALDYDPATQQFVMPIGGSLVTPAALLRYDPLNNTATTMTMLPAGSPTAATIAGSRHLAGISPATPGNTYQLRVSSPNEPGSLYAVAASFGTAGIQLAPGRKVYLTLDDLFNFSLTNSGIFSNFQGVLGGTGEAIASMQIPNIPALRGLRFYTAAVTLNVQGISIISEPVGVTIS